MRLVVLFLLLVPAAGALGIDNPVGAHDTTLHLHLDGNQDLRMTPQAPPAHWEQNVVAGLIGSNCVTTPGQTLTDQQHHTWYAIVSPAPVRYSDSGIVFSDRGLRGDLHLSEGTIGLDWYVNNTAYLMAHGPPAPQVSLRATLREGDTISVDNQAMNRGRILAQAETEPAILAPGLDSGDVTDHGNGIYGFHLDIPVAATAVPQSEGINLRIDVRILNPVCDDAGSYIAPASLGAHTSAAHRPVLRLGHERPVEVERMAVDVLDGVVEFTAHVRAPFGSADAILTRDHFRIDGPTPVVGLAAGWWDAAEDDGRFHPYVQGAATYRIDGSWVLPEGASGDHTLSFHVGSESQAVANATLPFRLGDESQSCSVIGDAEPTCSTVVAGKKSPAPMGLAVLVAAALLRRR